MVFYGHIYAYPILSLRNIEQVILSLNDEDPDDKTITIPQDFTGQTVRSVIDFHRGLSHKDQDVHPTLLVVLDTHDVSERGVLIVNLDYHNTIDAVRMPVSEAGISICSLSIDNTTWQETRESCNDQRPPLTAAKQFLVYGLNLDKDNLETSCQSLDDGLGALNVEEESEGFAEHRSIYVKGPLGDDLGQIKAGHGRVAREMGCSESMFAVADSTSSKEGVLLVNLDESNNEGHIRKTLPVAGEVFNWIYLGLWTWHEALGL
jgi:hypothetical protein